jgi:hypothetical protein
MVASQSFWLKLLATMKAAVSAVTDEADFGHELARYLSDSATIQESQRVSRDFTTYTDEQVRIMTSRLQACHDQFVQDGSPDQRVRCICEILNEARIGNGGRLPQIDDWPRFYRVLGCEGMYDRRSD